MNSLREPLYELRGVVKEFAGPTETVHVLRNIEAKIFRGEALAILGASGSGKTTLLHLLGTLDTPSRGEIVFEGRDLAGLSTGQRAAFRNRELGFVFQQHHLLPEFSTLENVAMPGLIADLPWKEARRMAEEALAHVGLSQRADFAVTTLSGGERQRAAIARAVLLSPKVLLADEPTGSLDEATGRSVGDMLLQLNRELDMTLVVVTHNLELASKMDRQLELHAGELNAHTPCPI
ncbi:ABC transporter related protein [Desulfovibrio sp. X2]|uniref:ABC transporter ATP-binding protein n=1 Tax=Desulfovibrio sp. X2 TaxID=941449 RepID=UPI000358C4A6|nr:ABC transporter ATP-binding protein [Desulfovibrio sp. X2]EPR37476.1 ABC transporter related protein [Desulfovibrio sp. X2]